MMITPKIIHHSLKMFIIVIHFLKSRCSRFVGGEGGDFLITTHSFALWWCVPFTKPTTSWYIWQAAHMHGLVDGLGRELVCFGGGGGGGWYLNGTLLDGTDRAIGCDGTTMRVGMPLDPGDAVESDLRQIRRGSFGSVEADDCGSSSVGSGVSSNSSRRFSPSLLPDSWGISLYCT